MAPWTDKQKLAHIPTPCYLINESELDKNLSILSRIKEKTNCKILLALKGYATYKTFDQIKPILDGVTASSIYEARLGYEEFQKEIHGYAVALSHSDCLAMNKLCTTLSLNSLQQLSLFKSLNKRIQPSLGLRINPMVSTVSTTIYDPCRKHSRLGIPINDFPEDLLNKIDGLHFHALCEQNTDALEKVLSKIKTTFGNKLNQLKWMNWGGGHQLTSPQYNIDHLIELIQTWSSTYNIEIILEPGEAIGSNCGYYVTSILDIVHNEKAIVICDISATAHMPDVLEYPYRPTIINSGKENEKKYNYIISGNTCLSGDIVGTYSFNSPLTVNDQLILTDMGHYTIVKTSNFNGIIHPSIGIIDKLGHINIMSNSNYFNFKEKLS